MSAWARPRKPRARRTVAAIATAVSPAANPPARMSSSLTNSGAGGIPLSDASDTPTAVAPAGDVLFSETGASEPAPSRPSGIAA